MTIMCLTSILSTIFTLRNEHDEDSYKTYMMAFVIAQNVLVIIIFCIRILSKQFYQYLNNRRIYTLIDRSHCNSDSRKIELIPDSKDDQATPSSGSYVRGLIIQIK
jgi:hypothetical protein